MRGIGGFFGTRAQLDRPRGEDAPPEPHTPLEANYGKELDIALESGLRARRYPIQTRKFNADSEMDTEVSGYVREFFETLDERGGSDDRKATEGIHWSVAISEKIIAIMQGRSWFVWDVKPGIPAMLLSKCVHRTPAGIGLGDPTTMQLAIKEAGLARIVFAAAGGAVGKLLGKRGVFYQLAGSDVRAIDGPTEYSVYPSNVSAKLPPKDPQGVAERLAAVIRASVPEKWQAMFDGVVIVDANDLGCNVLGNATKGTEHFYEQCFSDNPLGQGRQQTPIAVIFS